MIGLGAKAELADFGQEKNSDGIVQHPHGDLNRPKISPQDQLEAQT